MSKQQKTDKRLWWLLAAAAVLSVLWLLVTIALVGSTLDAADRDRVSQLLGSRLALISLTWGGGMAAIGWGLKRWFDHWVTPSVQLAEEAQVLLKTDVVRELTPKGNVETKELAKLFNQLVGQREALRREMDERVAQSAARIDRERTRLAALMAELSQSVVVCNLDGRILLYNPKARELFRGLSQAPGVAGGAELIGLGRSIYSALERSLVAHALESVQHQVRKGAERPSSQFVSTTETGRLLRVQMAPVREPLVGGADEPGLAMADITALMSGFVLMVDDITDEFEAEAARDQLMHTLTAGSRSSLANMQAMVDILDRTDLEPGQRQSYRNQLRDEAKGLSQRINALERRANEKLQSRWGMEDIRGLDLMEVASKRMEALGRLRISVADTDESVWLKVDSFSVVQVLTYLATRLSEEFEVRYVYLRLAASESHEGKAHLDLVWSGQVMNTETVMNWEMDPMQFGGQGSHQTVRDVIERHQGSFGFERERVRHEAYFRLVLPMAAKRERIAAESLGYTESRPEYYDFDLFQVTAQTRRLEDQPLDELVYTVFDTETTGLNPSQGDEIIQIGAARIVNGKLLRHECFEQLVDPKRSIPAASIPIHGIQPEMVKGQPTIEQVLPAFHQFAQDTVLVAHNAAFDMRFLQIKEKSTGVRFDQPVIDTLLLSALVHPNQDSHRLEAIAERFNITVVGRHTAMGDAMVTAEVLIRLIPLLAEKGILTLGQAMEAAQRTYYARLKY